jgi:hypothetical protein
MGVSAFKPEASTRRYKPNIVVSVTQELSKDVDGHDTQACIGLNLENC